MPRSRPRRASSSNAMILAIRRCPPGHSRLPGPVGPDVRTVVRTVCGRHHLAMRRPQAGPDSPRRPAPCPGADGGAAAVTPPSRPVGTHSASANHLFSTLTGRVQGNCPSRGTTIGWPARPIPVTGLPGPARTGRQAPWRHSQSANAPSPCTGSRPADAARMRALRLEMLADSPLAFLETLAQAAARPHDDYRPGSPRRRPAPSWRSSSPTRAAG